MWLCFPILKQKEGRKMFFSILISSPLQQRKQQHGVNHLEEGAKWLLVNTPCWARGPLM